MGDHGGIFIRNSFGIIIAIILWLSETCSKVLEPYLVVMNALPKIALGPVFIVWMGAGSVAIITITIAVSLIVTVLEVYTGFLETDAEKIRLVQSFDASKSRF